MLTYKCFANVVYPSYALPGIERFPAGEVLQGALNAVPGEAPPGQSRRRLLPSLAGFRLPVSFP